MPGIRNTESRGWSAADVVAALGGAGAIAATGANRIINSGRPFLTSDELSKLIYTTISVLGTTSCAPSPELSIPQSQFVIPKPDHPNNGLSANELVYFNETKTNFINANSANNIYDFDINNPAVSQTSNIAAIVAQDLSLNSEVPISPDQITYNINEVVPFWENNQKINFVTTLVEVPGENDEANQKFLFMFVQYPGGQWGQVAFANSPITRDGNNLSFSPSSFLDITNGDPEIFGLVSKTGPGLNDFGVIQFGEQENDLVMLINMPNGTIVSQIVNSDSIFNRTESGNDRVRLRRVALPTSTPDLSITATPSTIPTVESTPTPETVIDIFDSSALPTEMRNYLNNLASRTPAEAGSSLEARYVAEDKAFHDSYMDYMKTYLKSIGADISSIEAFSGTNWENYDNAVKAYELLWKQMAQNPENYNTNWQLTPWFLRGDGKTNLGMYDPGNFVRSIDRSYGFGYDAVISQEDFIKGFGATNLQEAMNLYRQAIRNDGFFIPISGINAEIQRFPAFGETYGILTAITDHPGYPDGSVKILIMAFQDENNKWVYQPFAVNLGDNKTGPGDYISAYQSVSPAPLDFDIRLAKNGPLDEEGYNVQKLIDLIGHAIRGNPDMAFDLTGGPNFQQLMMKGMETFGYIQNSNSEPPISPLSPK